MSTSSNDGMIYARVPELLRDRFKARCETLGISMQDRVAELMQQALSMREAPECKTEDTPVVMFVRSLPNDLKSKFKAWCALQGLSIEKGLASLMEMDTKKKMHQFEVQLPPHIRSFIDQKVQAGDYASPSEMIQQLLAKQMAKEEA